MHELIYNWNRKFVNEILMKQKKPKTDETEKFQQLQIYVLQATAIF